MLDRTKCSTGRGTARVFQPPTPSPVERDRGRHRSAIRPDTNVHMDTIGLNSEDFLHASMRDGNDVFFEPRIRFQPLVISRTWMGWDQFFGPHLCPSPNATGHTVARVIRQVPVNRVTANNQRERDADMYHSTFQAGRTHSPRRDDERNMNDVFSSSSIRMRHKHDSRRIAAQKAP